MRNELCLLLSLRKFVLDDWNFKVVIVSAAVHFQLLLVVDCVIGCTDAFAATDGKHAAADERVFASMTPALHVRKQTALNSGSNTRPLVNVGYRSPAAMSC